VPPDRAVAPGQNCSCQIDGSAPGAEGDRSDFLSLKNNNKNRLAPRSKTEGSRRERSILTIGKNKKNKLAGSQAKTSVFNRHCWKR